MSHAVNIHDGTGQISKDPDVGILDAYGTTVPADGSVGYAPACIFRKTDGTTLDNTLYVNIGTKASSNFDAATTS